MMRFLKKRFATGVVCGLLVPCFVFSAETDSLKRKSEMRINQVGPVAVSHRKTINLRSYIVPVALVGYGFAALQSKALKGVDRSIEADVPKFKTTFDNYLRHAPVLSAY